MDKNFFPGSEEEFQRYNQHNNTIENQGYVKFLNNFINTAQLGKLKNVKKALDFGCGPGPVLKILLGRMGINTDIYDPYFFPDKIFANKKYDLITCTEVFEHLKEPYQTIELLKSLLAPNGILAVKTLFHTVCQDFSSWWYREDCTHFCFYSPKTFEWIGKNFELIMKNMDGHSICVFEKK
ncbi:MAG: class I SAM-dependent methyltransferase [Bacillota bacterium]